MIKKFICMTLAIMFSLMVVGCKSESGTTGNGNEGGFNLLDVTITEEDFNNSGLEITGIADTDIDFVKNGDTDYKIVIEDVVLDRITKAAKDLAHYVNEATGANLPIVTESEVEYSANDKYIVIGCDTVQQQAGLAALTEDVGDTGYKIVQKDNSVFVQAKDTFGYSNSIYAILEYQIEWKIYSKDVITYTKAKDVKLKAFNVTEKPSYEFANPGNKLDIDTARRMRMVRQWDMFATIDGEICHTFLKYIPLATYQEKHPKWFNVSGKQLCLTARGDADELTKLVEEMANRVVSNLENWPYAKAVIIGQMDAAMECTCEACKAEALKYGTVSGAYVKFMNRVSDKIAELFAEQNIDRDIDLLFFAYQDSVAAPVVKNTTTGEYEPIDGLICRDNVAVYYAPMYADYADSFYDDVNAAFRDEVDKWSACTNKMYTFLYGTYYWNYLLPFNNYYSMTEHAKYFLENGAINYFSLGQSEPEVSSTFNSLKDYIEAKMLWDVNYSYKDIVVEFFKGTYGPAAYEMYQFFDSLTNYLEIQGDKFENINNIWGDIDNKDYNIWRYGVLKEWEGMIEKSFAALEPLQASDPTLYSMYYDKIDLEYLFIKYTYIEFCSSYFNAKDLLALKYSFKDAADRLNVAYVKEKGLLLDKYVDWGIA